MTQDEVMSWWSLDTPKDRPVSGEFPRLGVISRW